MQINNIQSQNFTGIRIIDGGMDFLEKEGKETVKIFEEIKDHFKHTKWNLEIHPDGYKLNNPSTQQTYHGPFTSIRHKAKGKLAIHMKNINEHTVSYQIICKTKEELTTLYKELKNLSGLKKMIKILKTLEGKE